tara:strand:+ start:419 stop:1198 length:780 start_codon:yes stop_codon:yes gene_type:complete
MSELYDQIEELMLELEDEDSDPVGSRTIAVIPGSFRPPHLGHLNMVKEYSQQVDEVVILVNSALKGSRGIGGKPMTVVESQQIWEMMLSDQGLSNVRIETSKSPTRNSAILEYIGEDGPIEPGTNVMLGFSSKGRAIEGLKRASKCVKEGVNIISPETTAVQPSMNAAGKPYSSSDIRKILDEGGDADEFFGTGRTTGVRSILRLGQLDEMSAMGAGAVAGSAVASGTKKRNKNAKKEYNEPYLYKEVLKLLMKEGISK